MKPKAFEVNFDGLVGPTHGYAGLSHGNVASTKHRALESNPLEAALQGLEKMKRLSDLGVRQALLPPQERPHLPTLRKLGFSGSDSAILEKAAKDSPELFSAVCSASAMWTANAATVSPSADTRDRKVHFTPANLVSKFHRSIEAETTSRVLKKIFKNPKYFHHHDPLPPAPDLGDEGAANHTRLCADYDRPGVEFFVYGREAFRTGGLEPKRFPARQTREASAAVARSHVLDGDAVVFAQHAPDAIDAGVFHNDVAGVGNQGVYFYHEQAYVDSDRVMQELQEKYSKVCGQELDLIRVPKQSVSLEDAVSSYLFNSQLLSLPGGGQAIVLPEECKNTPSVARYVTELLGTHGDLIGEALYFDLRQSMRNGGGPACLRLRVVLTERELKAAHSKVFWSDRLYAKLVSWAKKHYRDRLMPEDLRDPKLLKESRTALDQLTEILGLGSIYDFQV